ncbi:hypothetical protein D3C86_1792130 [compost metagenome]
MAEWQAALPSVPVEAELVKAATWHRANPSRQKTLRGMPRFLFDWLKRERRTQPQQIQQPSPPTPAAGSNFAITAGMPIWQQWGMSKEQWLAERANTG